MEIEFRIPYPTTKRGKSTWSTDYSLNAYYKGKEWKLRYKDAQYWHTLTTEALLKFKVPKEILTTPVEIWFGWNDGLDIDNHAAMGKMIVDALKGWVIKDDSRKYLHGVHHVFLDDMDSIVVLIRPYEKKERKNDTEEQREGGS